jgi:cell division protein FtsI (penicillin-binding protein 3)
MKPITVALALEKGLVKPNTMIQTGPGRITISGFTISDDAQHGTLTVEPVIQKSSNVGALKIAHADAAARDVGAVHGSSASASGRRSLPRRRHRQAAPLQDLAPRRAGHHELRLRPVGFAVPAGALLHVFARDGEIIPGDHAQERRARRGRARAFQPRTRRPCARCCRWPPNGGTGPRRRPWAIRSAARRAPRTSRKARAMPTNKYRGWFVGMAPIDKPRIVVAVMIDEPSGGKYFGGDVAAPVFSATVQQTLRMLGVQPDMSVKPQIVVQAVEESF